MRVKGLGYKNKRQTKWVIQTCIYLLGVFEIICVLLRIKQIIIASSLEANINITGKFMV